MAICQILVRFWCLYPALLYGVSLLLGFYGFFYSLSHIVIPLLALWFPFVNMLYQRLYFLWKPLVLSVSLFLTGWHYAFMVYDIPDLPKEGVQGTAHVSILSMRSNRSFFGSRWVYQCQLKQFHPQTGSSSIANNMKCSISFPDNENIVRPLAHRDYLVKGRLLKTDQGFLILKISPYTSWKIVQGSWNFTEVRYQLKKKLQNWINEHFSHSSSAAFLGGLASGDFDDQWLRGEFARFGLQHIMAISGFHFAIVMGILSLILRLFLSYRKCLWLLLILMGCYAFFLGANPSIMRAWIMCSLVLVGSLIEKSPVSLNSLGIALIGVLLYDPLFCQTIGFQFSFITTAAILLLYRPIDYYLGKVLTKRNLSKVIEMDSYNQHGYCILAFFKQGMALMCAVNLLAFPLTLYYFQQFPLMSLFYNLFFPFLVSISLCLLILGLLTAWLPLIGVLIQGFNNHYTHTLLKLTYGFPSSLDYIINIDTFSHQILLGYFTGVLLIGIYYSEQNSTLDEPGLLLVN